MIPHYLQFHLNFRSESIRGSAHPHESTAAAPGNPPANKDSESVRGERGCKEVMGTEEKNLGLRGERSN